MTRLAIALGGNALIRRGEPGSTEVQRHNLVAAARGLVTLAEGSRAEIVLTHGNGPQVGFLAIGAEMAASVVPAPPLDVLGRRNAGPDRLPAGPGPQRRVPGAGTAPRDGRRRDPDRGAGRRPGLRQPDQAGRARSTTKRRPKSTPRRAAGASPRTARTGGGSCLAAADPHRGGRRDHDRSSTRGSSSSPPAAGECRWWNCPTAASKASRP